MLIGVHRRSSAAIKGFENSRPENPHINWPPMNADERRCPDSLTEQVLAAIFEVSNTLRSRLPRKSLRACSPKGTRSSSHTRQTPSQISGSLQGPTYRRLLRRYLSRRLISRRAKVCRAPDQRTYRPVSQLSESLQPDCMSLDKLPKSQSRMEADRKRLSARLMTCLICVHRRSSAAIKVFAGSLR